MRGERRAFNALLALGVAGLAGLVAADKSQARPNAQANVRLPAVRVAQAAVPAVRPKTVVSHIALADIGFDNGFRLANLGARREIFIPLPADSNLKIAELTLHYDDLSAYKARRNLEVLVNDRTVAAVPLEGNGADRVLQVPLGKAGVRDGFIKLTFLYSGAATPDRCIDVRYVGDSLTVRPETSLAVEFDAGLRDVTIIAALMPRVVDVVLPERALGASELSAALTVARALAASGRRATFTDKIATESETGRGGEPRLWSRGTIIIGAPITGSINGGRDPVVPGELSAIRVGGMPALLLSDVTNAMRAARLLATPSLAAARGMSSVSVAGVARPRLASDRVTFDQLGIRPPAVEVYGRAELSATLDARQLPANTWPARLILDVLVAPDGAGDRAVVSLFVGGRFLASTVAAVGGPTRIDQPLPEGLVGALTNIQVLVQRRSAGGECRFEPQGYPAQILGSSVLMLQPAGTPRDFADLATRWTEGVEVMVPPEAAHAPARSLPLLADVLTALTPEVAPINVNFASAGAAPSGPFLSVSAVPPQGAEPRVRFDRGRVMVRDRSGQTLLDLGGFQRGAVAQLVEAGGHPGIWIKGLATDGRLPAPTALKLDRGDVAFLDDTGVALAMSTVRDTLLLVTYPDQISWTTVSARYSSWIVGALWLFATIAFLFALQRMLRRRHRATEE